MKAVIMTGGKGTRLVSLTNDRIPKPMTLVCGKPILHWQIEKLKENDISEIMLVTGHLGQVIHDYFRDGEKFGVSIQYYQENSPLGSAGALAFLGDWIGSVPFFLSFGDILFDMQISRMQEFHRKNNAWITILAHPNDHPFDSDLVVINEENRVGGYLKKGEKRNTWYDNYVSAGLFIIESDVCKTLEPNVKADLVHDVVFPAVQKGKRIYAYRSPEYIKDVGTPERLEQAEAAIKSGFLTRWNLKNKQRAIFLDRDGTVNEYKGLVFKPEDLELENGIARAIKLIHQSGYLAIIVTNQPCVARGLCSISDVEGIHKKLKALLGEEGAYLDAIYYCPHHPDKGYPEENPKYKMSCTCRKPQIGLLERAQKDFNIDLSDSWMIGDTTVDVETGRRAGTRTILLKTGLRGSDQKHDVKPDLICNTLEESIKMIVEAG